jgi:hypothetical protein
MAMTKMATGWRAAAGNYSECQQLLVGLWLFDVWDTFGFTNMFDGEERRFVPRLLVGTCVAAIKKRPLTITDAFVVMDAKHGRTAAKYIGVAETHGFVKRVRDPGGDKRKTVLLPTDKLHEKFVEEVKRVADDARDLMAAMVLDGKGLPKTGAAELTLKPGRNENRHSARAEMDAPFPARNWSVSSYTGPK